MKYDIELPYDSGPIKHELPPLHDVNEIAAELGFDALAALMHETALEKGFWPEKYYDNVPRGGDSLSYKAEVTEEAICTKLALVHSEVTEVLEAIRKSQGEEKVVEEMADVIIRLLDLYAAMKNTGQVDSSLDDVVQSKMRKNALRPKLHGNRF